MTLEHSARSERRDRPAPSSRPLFILIGLVVAVVAIGLAIILALIGLLTIASSETSVPPTPMVELTPAQQPGGAVPPTVTPTPTVVATPVAGSPTPMAVASPIVSPTPLAVVSPVIASSTPGTEPPPPVLAVRFALASQLRVQSLDEIRIVSWEQVDWPNGCLGISIRDTMCTEAIVPGYRIILENQTGLQYIYRTDLSGMVGHLESAPPTGIEWPALIWEGSTKVGGSCESLVLAPNGEALVGPCGAPPMPLRLFEEMGRTGQLTYFLNRFAPFTAETSAGQVKFHGTGQEIASPAWQRAISQWSRIALRELQSGRSGASWGLGLAWHQAQGAGDRCRNLQVEVYGLAYASTSACVGGEAQDLGQGWLSTDDLVTLYGWLDRLAAFDRPLPERLVFSGTGTQTASDAEVVGILDWAERQYDRLVPPAPVGSREKAIESARKIDANVTWQAFYVADYGFEANGKVERRPTWIVEATYPLGNKVVAYVDATTSEIFQVTQVEPPPNAAPTLRYMWPTRTPLGLVIQPGQSSATENSFVLELAEPGGGQFRATVVGGHEPRARDRAYGVGGQPVTIHGQQAMAYPTGAGYSVYWAEDSQPYAVISGLGLADVVALAEGLQPLDRSAWQQRLASTR